MKPCSQVKGFGTNFHGYVLPKYSLFGNVNGVLYVCTSFGYIHTILDKKSKVTKTKDFPLKIWNGYRWTVGTTEDYPSIKRYIVAFMRTKDYIHEKSIPCRRDTRAIASIVPQVKKHPQPMYGSRSGCYSQARVDGQGYDISWEEDSKPVFGHGLPVKYSEGHRLPPAGFNSFEGYTDTPEARRRDGMKIKQIKCRPGKVYVVETQAKK